MDGDQQARVLATDCDLVLVARRGDRLADLAGELRDAGATVELLPADLGTRAGVVAVTSRLAAGDVRFLISNAGVGGYTPLADVDPADVDRLLTLNAVAPSELVRAALPWILAAAKAASVAFTRTLTGELAGTASGPRWSARASARRTSREALDAPHRSTCPPTVWSRSASPVYASVSRSASRAWRTRPQPWTRWSQPKPPSCSPATNPCAWHGSGRIDQSTSRSRRSSHLLGCTAPEPGSADGGGVPPWYVAAS